MAKEKIQKSPLIELQEKKVKHLEELIEKYRKLYDYIEPLLTGNSEMKKLASSIKMDFIILPMMDISLHMAYAAHNMVMHGQKLDEAFESMEKDWRKENNDID